MKLYEIDQQIRGLIDPDTGEVADWQTFERLQIERGKAIEGLALLYREKAAEKAAADAERDRLESIGNRAEHQMERLKLLLDDALGEDAKFETGLVSVTTRRTSAIQIDDEDAAYRWLDTHRTEWRHNAQQPYTEYRKLNKRGLAAVLLDHDVPGVRRVNSRRVSVK